MTAFTITKRFTQPGTGRRATVVTSKTGKQYLIAPQLCAAGPRFAQEYQVIRLGDGIRCGQIVYTGNGWSDAARCLQVWASRNAA